MPSSRIKVWKHREINEPQRFVAPGERFTLVVGGSSEVGVAPSHPLVPT